MIWSGRTLVAIVGILGTTACGSSDPATPDAGSSDSNGAEGEPSVGLPALAPGAHLGVWTTYELVPIGLAATIDTRLAQARSAGMTIGRVHISWAELEPSPGHFDLETLREGLEALTSDGLAAHVLLETVDSDGFSLPADLVDPTTAYTLRDGRRFDDPVILARFSALVSAISPVLAAHRVFAISIGNEPDSYFDDIAPTSAEGIAWRDALTNFLTAGRTALHATLPELPVALTFRQGALEKGWTSTIAPVITAGDAAIFNYYCQDEAFQVKSPSLVAGELDAMIAVAGGLPIVLQELGCPAGEGPSHVNASEAAQAAFYAAVFEAMRTRPTIRAAFAFQLVDWSPGLAATYGDAYRDEGYPELADQVEETLGTIGLLRYANGATRLAWTELISKLESLR